MVMPGKEYEQYERACAKIREDNTKLMADFEQGLAKKGLGIKTIREHVQNVDFYVNTFLLYEEAIPASKGATRVSSFLGDWFIRKALWASRSSIRESAASLKKFYAFMHEQGQIDADELQELKETIKEEMPEWLEAVEDYDDSGSDPLERWGL
jgi:site-specific recombinase XerD